jgi:hypothetical protein
MSYTINRSSHILDEITLKDNGETLTIKVDLVIDDILAGYSRAMKALSIARRDVEAAQQSDDPDALQTAHTAFCEGARALFELFFGADQTQQLTDFYNGRYSEMLGDFLPYIREVLLPQIEKAKEAAVQRYTAWKG